MELLGDPHGARMAQDASRVASGAPFLKILGPILAPRWAKKAPRWAKFEPSWRQYGQFGTKMAILDPILAIFLRLGGDPSRNSRSVKTSNTLSLLVVFWGLGPPLEGPGGCLGSVLGAMLEDVGSKMVFFWISWEMLWHLGAKMAHRSAKTRQDRRT